MPVAPRDTLDAENHRNKVGSGLATPVGWPSGVALGRLISITIKREIGFEDTSFEKCHIRD